MLCSASILTSGVGSCFPFHSLDSPLDTSLHTQYRGRHFKNIINFPKQQSLEHSVVFSSTLYIVYNSFILVLITLYVKLVTYLNCGENNKLITSLKLLQNSQVHK